MYLTDVAGRVRRLARRVVADLADRRERDGAADRRREGLGGDDPEARVVRVGHSSRACAARTSSTAACRTRCCSSSSPRGSRNDGATVTRFRASWPRSTRPTSCRPTAACRSRSCAARARSSGTARASEYLDFLSGLAVTSLGHAHPEVADAIAEQARTLLHVSNLYYNDVQPRVAERLNALLGGGGRVFFAQLRRRGQRVRDQARPPVRPEATAAPTATT